MYYVKMASPLWKTVWQFLKTLKIELPFESEVLLLFFLRFHLFVFREGGREGEREGDKHQCVVDSWASPTGDLARNQAHALAGN